MLIRKTNIKDLSIIESSPYSDDRGAFERIFCANTLSEELASKSIVQINRSFTKNRGAIRGMHFQHPPYQEQKFIRCIRGSVFDVVVDLRRGSPTFLQIHSEILSADNHLMMQVPEGFAHGFQTLQDGSELLYLHTNFYTPQSEGGVRFSDPKLNIAWPVAVTDISSRDRSFELISDDFVGIAL